MSDVLAEGHATMEEIIVETPTPGIDVAPATLELASTEVELFSAIGREQALREALDGSVLDTYDYVLIDCPPTLGLLTINGLVAAHYVIIPVQTQYYALKGLTALVKVINTIRQKLNRDLKIMGLLPTFYDGRTILGREMLDEMRELGDHHVFDTIIRQTVKLGEAPLTGRPITVYAGSSEAAKTYRRLAAEVIDLA
jgi:chromosome partitioning protein